MDFLDELRALTAKDMELLGPFCVHQKYIKPAIAEIGRLRADAGGRNQAIEGCGVMDIIEKLDGLQAQLLPGDVWQQAIAEAIAEIRRLRSIAGPVDPGPSAADLMEALRNTVQDGIAAEKALATVYEADMEAGALNRKRPLREDVKAYVMDSAALRETYEFRPLPRACSTSAPPQSGSVRAKLWD